MLRSTFAFAVLFALLSVPTESVSQSLEGVLTDGAGEFRIPDAVVSLLTPAGFEVARARSGEDGEFQLDAPAAGEYRVRAILTGSSTTVSPVLQLRPGERRDYELPVVQLLVRLDGITVQGRDGCGADPSYPAGRCGWGKERTR